MIRSGVKEGKIELKAPVTACFWSIPRALSP